MKIKILNNKILTTGIFLAATTIATVAGAQYYDPSFYNQNYYANSNYGYDYNNNNNYSQPYGVTSFNSGSNYYDNNSYYNNNVGYSNYNYDYNNYNNSNYSYVDPTYSNYNYNNNYNYNYYQSLSAVTYAATKVSSNKGTINGYVNSSNGGTYYNSYNNWGTAWFEYGTSYSNLNQRTNPANIYTSTTINAHLTNLACGTVYYFRAVTSNGGYGNILSFQTSSCYNNVYGYNNYYNNNYSTFGTNCGTNNRRPHY